MTLKEYDEKAATTAIYKDRGQNIVYPVLGLAGEAGEVADKLKKMIANTGPASILTPEQKKAFLAEVGDVLWFVSACAYELGSSLEEVAQMNLEKLASRKARGVIQGEGDDR